MLLETAHQWIYISMDQSNNEIHKNRYETNIDATVSQNTHN